MLIAKKRYLAGKRDRNGNLTEIDAKGVELVRRDFCEFVQETLRKTLEFVIPETTMEANIVEASCLLSLRIKQLCMGEVAIHQLTLSKALSKHASISIALPLRTESFGRKRFQLSRHPCH